MIYTSGGLRSFPAPYVFHPDPTEHTAMRAAEIRLEIGGQHVAEPGVEVGLLDCVDVTADRALDVKDKLTSTPTRRMTSITPMLGYELAADSADVFACVV